MSEVLLDYERPVEDATGTAYTVRACGREVDGRWEGWFEFVPEDGSALLRSERETTQPNRTDIDYWATGITPVYLEGALQRTLEPRKPVYEARPGRPAYEGPAPSRGHERSARSTAILDPYSVRSKGGEELLRKELRALSAWHLRNIVRAYGLADERQADVEALGRQDLVEMVVAATRSLAS